MYKTRFNDDLAGGGLDVPSDSGSFTPQATHVATGVRPRFAPRLRGLPWVGSAASVLIAFAVLETVGRLGILDRSSFPLASEVLDRLISEAGGAQFWQLLGQTLLQAISGLAIACVLGIPAGLLLGRIAILDNGFRPVIEFIRTIPSVAILPLVILTLGMGFRGALLLTTMGAFWFILVLTIQGARSVDPLAQQALAVFGVPRPWQVWYLILPSAAPMIMTGVRVAASISLIVAVTVELIGGMPGLGQAVQLSLQSSDSTGVYAYIVTAGLLGVLLNAILRPVENRILSWHPSRRAAR